MQVGEKYLAGSQQGIFGRLRFLHLHDQPRPLEDCAVVGQHRRACMFVIGIGKSRAHARAVFHEHLVAAFDELIRRRWQQRHAVLVLFDFFWNADDHIG
jgi:hypothetical protein